MDYDTLIEPFVGLEDWQPIHHFDYLAHYDGHATITAEALAEMFIKQVDNCSRFQNMTVQEAGISKQDITELRDLDLL